MIRTPGRATRRRAQEGPCGEPPHPSRGLSLRELELLQRGGAVAPAVAAGAPALDAEDVEDLEDAPDDEVVAAEEEILDQATAARTIAEPKAEIDSLRRLEALALAVRRSGEDKKWRELASLLGEIFTRAALVGRVAEPESPPPYGSGAIPKPEPSPRQKLVLFTEHRDTLSYLEQRVTVGRRNNQGGHGSAANSGRGPCQPFAFIA